MKAIVYHKYGSPDVLELADIDKPVVTDDDVLVRVRAASVNPFDWHFMNVCAARNVDMVRSIGADHVIDYTQEDYTRSGQRYDLIFDAAGNHSLSDNRRVLRSKGTLVMVGGAMNGNWIRPLLPALMAIVISPFVSHTLALLLTRGSKEDLIIMQRLLEARTVTPVIDRTYPLSEAPEAIRYLEQGHARGKVVITVGTA